MKSNLTIYLLAYVLILFVITYIVSRRQSKEDFLISGRNRGGWQIMFSKFASAIGAGYFISYTGFAYEYGLGLFAMLFGIIIGYLAFAYWAAPRIAKESKEKKFYTIGHFVYDKTKSKLSMYTADIFSSAILFSWLLTGIIGGAKIINDFGLLSYNLAVGIISLVVLIYLLMAGHKAVILTDIIQSIVIFILLMVVTFGIVGGGEVGTALTSNAWSIDWTIVIGFFLFGILSVFSYSDRYQLAYAAKNERGLKHGLGLSIVPIIIAGLFLLIVGMYMAVESPGIDSGIVFTEALKNFLPPTLLPLAIVLFFAGIMSSADTGIYAIASHFAMYSKREKVGAVRYGAVWLVIITAILAILFPEVVDVSIIAGGLSLTLSFSMVYLIMGGTSISRFLFSAILAMITLVASLVLIGFEPAIAIPVLIVGAIGLLFRSERVDGSQA